MIAYSIGSDRVLEAIKEFEGFRAKAYQDAVGIWTIGYGRTGRIHEGETTTREFEERWLINEIIRIGKAVLESVKVPLIQNQLDALISFTYNVGLGALHRSTLLKRINANDADAHQEFHKWIHAKGRVLPGLVKRRQREADWFSEHLSA